MTDRLLTAEEVAELLSVPTVVGQGVDAVGGDSLCGARAVPPASA